MLEKHPRGHSRLGRQKDRGKLISEVISSLDGPAQMRMPVGLVIRTQTVVRRGFLPIGNK